MAKLLIPIGSLALVLTGFIAVGASGFFSPRARGKQAAQTVLRFAAKLARRARMRLSAYIRASATAAGRLDMCCLKHCKSVRAIPVAVVRSASGAFWAVTSRIQARRRWKLQQTDQATATTDTPDLDVLNCRARLGPAQTHRSDRKAFLIDLCGSIHSYASNCTAVVHIEVADITDGPHNPQPVTTADDYGAIRELSTYSYSADIGTLSQALTTLHDWTLVARIPVDQLVLARWGKRSLLFHVSVRAKDTQQELAATRCDILHDNTSLGYLDRQDNVRRARDLAVAIAFSLAAADGKLFASEVETIKRWARSNILSPHPSAPDAQRLEKALERTVSFFRNAGRLDLAQMCDELVRIVPVGQRYEILDLCLNVAKAKGHAAAEELGLLKQLSAWLDVEPDKYRTMMEKILPVDMHRVKDTETILGITPGMSQDEARRQLNKEYAKWNARVTSVDPAVRDQAEQMLQLIAQARSKSVGVTA